MFELSSLQKQCTNYTFSYLKSQATFSKKPQKTATVSNIFLSNCSYFRFI